jgi:protein-disulfide isomerase/uncharacterized membrane protein
MKKFTYPLLALAIAGTLISGILLLQHYYPDAKIGFISCGQGIFNPCLSLAQSGYATIFTIPVAAYGLLWYLLALFILLIADYAGGRYHAFALALLLPLGIAAVLADVALGIILIVLGLLCPYCIASYGVNICMLVLAILWFRFAQKEERFSLPETLRELLSAESSPDRKAFYSAFVLFLFLLSFAIFATSHILKIKTEGARIPEDKTTSFLANFYRSPIEKINFPDTGIVLGNPKAVVTIVAFTDFLCSACHEFYRIETLIFSKYRDRVKTVYYNYPLDTACNSSVNRVVYKNSCVAARAFLAASEGNIVEEYIVKHFADYQNTHTRYDQGMAIAAFNQINIGSRRGLDEKRFLAMMNADSTGRKIQEHVGLAKQLGINATPTLFIAGRRLVGVPPVEILDQLIKNELAGAKPSQ